MSDAVVEVEGQAEAGFRFRISDISPVPDDDVVAAITAALHEVWPQPTAVSAPLELPNASWRFGQRRWQDRQIPRRTWGRSD
ncbi:MAG: hypothetical protein R8J94_07005 [Acidimicrobiia bacterium]|nr:hypothetical protein [Acidimicrobiia bacterium]